MDITTNPLLTLLQVVTFGAAVAIFAFCVWLIGYLHRRQGNESPSLGSRAEACFFVPFLAGAYTLGILLGLAVAFCLRYQKQATSVAAEWGDTVLWLMSFIWLAFAVHLWRQRARKWALTGKALWLPFIILVLGSFLIDIPLNTIQTFQDDQRTREWLKPYEDDFHTYTSALDTFDAKFDRPAQSLQELVRAKLITPEQIPRYTYNSSDLPKGVDIQPVCLPLPPSAPKDLVRVWMVPAILTRDRCLVLYKSGEVKLLSSTEFVLALYRTQEWLQTHSEPLSPTTTAVGSSPEPGHR